MASDAAPQAQFALFAGMTHMLKADVPGDPAASYQDPALPLQDGVMKEIVRFITAPRE